MLEWNTDYRGSQFGRSFSIWISALRSSRRNRTAKPTLVYLGNLVVGGLMQREVKEEEEGTYTWVATSFFNGFADLTDMRRHIRYHIGWSYGKEKLESGEPDTLKGSFFANPILDIPTTDRELMNRYPAYCRPNMWPTNHLPELEVAYKALGRLMLEVGLMLAHHCDLYVRQGVGNSDGDALEQIIGRSRCPKGRLLYYLPRKFSQKTESAGSISSWQGWHTDWGSLTGLTHDLFVRNSVEIPCPDSTAGLYVRTHSNHDVKVIFGEDELAYQIGETTEVLSGGRLCATPHCVKAPNGDDASDVARCTFVMFMQPNWDEKLQFPSEMPYHQELIPPNRELMFGEYSQRRLDKFTAANGGLVAHRLHAT